MRHIFVSLNDLCFYKNTREKSNAISNKNPIATILYVTRSFNNPDHLILTECANGSRRLVDQQKSTTPSKHSRYSGAKADMMQEGRSTRCNHITGSYWDCYSYNLAKRIFCGFRRNKYSEKNHKISPRWL